MADCHLVAYESADLPIVAITSRTEATARSVAERHAIPEVKANVAALLEDERVRVVDVAVPPDQQAAVIRQICSRGQHVRGVLAQKPLGVNLAEARELVALCEGVGITLAVNQNMRYDQSVRACSSLLRSGMLGDPVLGTIEMRAIPHWMPWQADQGWVTLRILSIHHLDTFRFWFGDPDRVFASVRPDPRTTFPHDDGIALYVLEYDDGPRASGWDDVWAGPCREGAASDIGIRWRVEGTRGMARGTIGWPDYPARTPSTLEYTTIDQGDQWIRPQWDEVWFPDAFLGPMAELLCALEDGEQPSLSGAANLGTMALVDACYVSAKEHRVVDPREILVDR